MPIGCWFSLPIPPPPPDTRPHKVAAFHTKLAAPVPAPTFATTSTPIADTRLSARIFAPKRHHPTPPCPPKGEVGIGGKRLPSGQRRVAASDPQMGSLTSVGCDSTPRADQTAGAGGRSPIVPPTSSARRALPHPALVKRATSGSFSPSAKRPLAAHSPTVPKEAEPTPPAPYHLRKSSAAKPSTPVGGGWEGDEVPFPKEAEPTSFWRFYHCASWHLCKRSR